MSVFWIKIKKKSDGNMNIYQEICFPFDKKKIKKYNKKHCRGMVYDL